MSRYKFINELNEWGKPSHIHTLDSRPLNGTSTVLQVLSKPLTFWAAETSAVECLEAGIRIPTIREEYLLACAHPDKKKAIDALQKKYPIFKKARFAHFADKDEKAEKGTDRHEILSRFCKGEKITDKEQKLIQSFINWSKDNVKRFISSEGHCYSEKAWVGGIFDLLFEDKEGKIAIMDFKSSKEVYFSQFLQCSAYDLQITENGVVNADGNEVYKLEKPISYYAVFPFGMKNPEPEFFHNTVEAKQAFLAALVLYRINKKHEQ